MANSGLIASFLSTRNKLNKSTKISLLTDTAIGYTRCWKQAHNVPPLLSVSNSGFWALPLPLDLKLRMGLPDQNHEKIGANIVP